MQQYQPMIIGAIAILVMIFMPMGLVGLPADPARRGKVKTWRRRHRGKRLSPVAPTGRSRPESRVRGDREVLEVKDLSRHFGGLAAVNKVDVTVEEGEILGLIGPNGAGKSTMLNLIDGTLKASGGTITFKGHNITRYPPHRRAHLGIARVFQKNALFKSMTVLENVLAGSYLRTNTVRGASSGRASSTCASSPKSSTAAWGCSSSWGCRTRRTNCA